MPLQALQPHRYLRSMIPFARLFFGILICALTLETSAQIVFNKTEHDFGKLAGESGIFQHDFIFRNLNEHPVNIMTVRSVASALTFVYTRSEVLQGEYGFVKVKINTDSMDGLFHDEVYITMLVNDEVKNEVLYVRAMFSDDGKQKDNRAFEDGELATSVEVSPEDIESLEGFTGSDKLNRAASEIEYLKRQLELKSDLIAKLSDDLFQKQALEKENFNRLSELEKSLKDNPSKSNNEALNQLEELTERLIATQTSDSVLRQEIQNQEVVYAKLKAEADSARKHAQNLSYQLQEKFKSEARAMERAQKLEKDLIQKDLAEKRQQAQIDSLHRLVQLGENDESVKQEINKLQKELDIKRQEQQMQEQHAQRQLEKIEALNRENERYKLSADSLSDLAASRENEADLLQAKLEESNTRMSKYESMLDSLQNKAASMNDNQKMALQELESLRQELNAVEERDEVLKTEISKKEQALSNLSAERELARKNIEALERATTKQQELTHTLMHRLNGLAEKESAAQIEMNALKLALKESQYREDSTRQAVNEMVEKISENEASLTSLSEEINTKEKSLQALTADKLEANQKLLMAQHQLSKESETIDSLETLVNAKTEAAKQLESDIIYLQKQVLASHQKEADYIARAKDLESRLNNARLSNDLTFQELKSDVDAMRNERDMYKTKFADAQSEIAQLKMQLNESRKNEENAIAFAQEMQLSSKSAGKPNGNVLFSVNVLTSESPLNMSQTFKGKYRVREYIENGAYRYALGAAQSLSEAIKLKDELKAQGYDMAFIVAFEGEKRISLKEAMEKSEGK